MTHLKVDCVFVAGLPRHDIETIYDKYKDIDLKAGDNRDNLEQLMYEQQPAIKYPSKRSVTVYRHPSLSSSQLPSGQFQFTFKQGGSSLRGDGIVVGHGIGPNKSTHHRIICVRDEVVMDVFYYVSEVTSKADKQRYETELDLLQKKYCKYRDQC